MVTPWISVDDLPFSDSPYAQTAVEYATFVLYKLSGEKYPGVTKTVESYVRETSKPSRDIIIGGREVSIDSSISVPTNISHPQRLYLRGTPVHRIHSVHIGGELLSPTKYSLHNKKFLRMNAGSYWNFGIDRRGITVEYSYGMLPPSAGILAATTLASELLVLIEDPNPDHCRIPQRVQSISREGISFDMIDHQEFLNDGRTGIWEIDLFLRTANPARAKKQPRIISPHDARRYK